MKMPDKALIVLTTAALLAFDLDIGMATADFAPLLTRLATTLLTSAVGLAETEMTPNVASSAPPLFD